MLRLDLDPTRALSVQSYTIEGLELLFRVRWREEVQAWFADLETADGDVLFKGRRLSNRGVIDADRTLPGHPGGGFVVIGPDPYVQADLGRSLQVFYLTAAELAQVTTRDPLAAYSVVPS